MIDDESGIWKVFNVILNILIILDIQEKGWTRHN